LPEVAGAAKEEDVRRLLEKKLEGFTVDKWGVFVRTYYGTMRRSPLLHVAHDRNQLLARATNLVTELSDHQTIGGLAVRERLPIQMVATCGGRRVDALEWRVFAGFGTPWFWSCHADLEGARAGYAPGDLERLALRPDEQEAVRSQTARLAGKLRARFLVADFARLEDGKLVLVEVNPGHSCGWGHHAALVGAFARFARAAAGLPPVEADQLAAVCQAQGIDLWGRGLVFGLF
jgi:hypothetical protein